MMNYILGTTVRPTAGLIRRAIVLFTAITSFALAAIAQTATVQGTLGSFDVINESGHDTHGFEIQIEGAAQNDLYYTGYGQRYGAGRVTSYATGVNIRWESSYDAVNHVYTLSTPRYTPGTPVSWGNCYQAGPGYSTSGCENFGQGMRTLANIVTIRGYWLIEDPANPGRLIRYTPNVAIPLPTWSIGPTTVVSSPPVVVAEIEAPEPPEAPELYGNAQWIKIFKTQLDHEVTESDLATGVTLNPANPTQVDVDWDIIQTEPPSGGNGTRTRSRRQDQGGISPTTRAVLRRYETYRFTGTYDAATHKALCADLVCKVPAAGELGVQIGGSNSAVNVIPDSVVVSKLGTGGGNVDSAEKAITCGNKCAGSYVAGTTVTLTAKPNSNSTFTGWTGACAGTSLTCTVGANGVVGVGAAFTLNGGTPPASVSGRVTTPTGAGLKNAVVSIVDPLGVKRAVITNAFGVYSFSQVLTGQSYTIAVSSKRFRFASQVMPVNANLSSVDFTGIE